MEEENISVEKPKRTRKKEVAEEESPKEVVYPKIRGGICEFCGVRAVECEHYGELFLSGKFRCLCGGSDNPSTFRQSIYWYLPRLKIWICNSDSCRRLISAMSGLTAEERKELTDFYLP